LHDAPGKKFALRCSNASDTLAEVQFIYKRCGYVHCHYQNTNCL